MRLRWSCASGCRQANNPDSFVENADSPELLEPGEELPITRNTSHENRFPSRSAASKVAFCLSTKDRPEWTRAVLSDLAAEPGMDLIWVDGSRTPEGKALPLEVAPYVPQLREIHFEVTGGPDVAIIHSLCRMRELGYEYCGLLENDVRLKPGWLPKILDLFRRGAADGLRVGAATARTYLRRVVTTRPDYAVLFNCGAGMILLRKEAAASVLRRYRTTTAQEIRKVFLLAGGVDVLPNLRYEIGAWPQILCADWFFDSSLLLDGYCTLGVLPALAEDLDPRVPAMVGPYASGGNQIVESEDALFAAFVKTHGALARAAQQPVFAQVGAIMRREDLRSWHAFPHQMIAGGIARLHGPWHIRWVQPFGPFAFETEANGARISIDVFGPAAFLFMIPAGNMEICDLTHAAAFRWEVPDEQKHGIMTCRVGTPSDSSSYVSRRIEMAWIRARIRKLRPGGSDGTASFWRSFSPGSANPSRLMPISSGPICRPLIDLQASRALLRPACKNRQPLAAG